MRSSRTRRRTSASACSSGRGSCCRYDVRDAVPDRRGHRLDPAHPGRRPATLPRLPRLSQQGRDGRPPGLPLSRGSVAPPRVVVGPYTVEAEPESFVGLRYLDTDGSTIWCYHSERARGLGIADGAMEIATRAPIAGWTGAL